MPRQLPVRELELQDFARLHGPLWLECYEQIGLREALAEKHAEEASALRAAAAARVTAEQAQRAAQEEYERAEASYRKTASGCIRAISSHALLESNPEAVFITADLHVPRRADRHQRPGQPTSMRAELDTVSGVLTVEWDCRNPRTVSGTVYTVQRRTTNGGGVGEWTDLGHVSRPRFVDRDLPRGAEQVEYRVTARRASLTGDPSTPLFVRLGGGPAETPALVINARAA